MPAASNAVTSIFDAGRRATSTRRKEACDPDLLQVEHNFEIPAARVTVSKYEPVFRKMRPGSAVRCEPKEAGAISGALRKALKYGQLPALAGCRVRCIARCADGHARVVAVKAD